MGAMQRTFRGRKLPWWYWRRLANRRDRNDDGGVVGGLAVGSPGAVGSIYEGYTLSWGDDFTSLDVLRPSKPRGRWFTTRVYLSGARGSDTALGTQYDTDPFMTGHNDSNRGTAVGYGNMRVASSVLELQARKATAGEQTHMSSVRNEVAAMVAGHGAVHWHADAQDTGDIIYEAKIKFSAVNPLGWHPTMWLQSVNPTIAITSDELDWEGNSSTKFLYNNVWTAGVAAGQKGVYTQAHDDAWHTVSFKMNKTYLRMYMDAVSVANPGWNCNTKNKPASPLFSSHIVSTLFEGETYSAAQWNAAPAGALMSVDWVRVWRRTGKTHYKPLVAMADQNVVYGQSTVITLPAKLALWGSTSPTEYLQVIYNEENEPDVTHTTVFAQFPSGVSYNTGTRDLTVNVVSPSKSGRMNFVLSAWEVGGTGEPLRFAVNLSPNITQGNISGTVGTPISVDLYAACDCGVLVPKTISVSGLAGSGLSYSSSTGLLTGNPLEGTFSSVVITATNLVGQQTQKTITITIAAVVVGAYAAWTGPGWFDASDVATVVISGGTDVSALNNKRAGGNNLTYNGTAGDLDSIAAGQNGLNVLRLTRDVAGARPRLQADVASPVSTLFQGNDKPYTVIAAFKPTDANTGWIWSASDTVDATDSQQIGLVRRSGSASSIRRQLVTATPNDVSWGSGFASGTARIVAIKHSGTAVTVWDTSLTKSVDASAQDTATFNSALIFYVFAAEINNAADPTYHGIACAQDFYEIVIEDSAKLDADITQAITDLATKWGITLT